MKRFPVSKPRRFPVSDVKRFPLRLEGFQSDEVSIEVRKFPVRFPVSDVL